MVRTTSFRVPVSHGERALSAEIDRACNMLENEGAEVVGVSHATHNEGFENARVWTVVIAYRKARA